MPGFRFSVPYNNDFSLLERIVEMKEINRNRIEEVYFFGPQEYFGSGRVVQRVTIEDIVKVIKFCKENGLKTNLLLNSTCEGIEWYSPLNVSRVLKLVKVLHLDNGLFKCPYRIFHFNLISHWSKEGILPKDYFFFNCPEITRRDPSQILKSCWINPENLKRYKEITNYFKITGRTRNTKWILNTVKAYMEEELKGNLLDIMDSNLDFVKNKYDAYVDNKELERLNFFDKVLSCNKNCFRCKFCEEIAGKVVKFKDKR